MWLCNRLHRDYTQRMSTPHVAVIIIALALTLVTCSSSETAVAPSTTVSVRKPGLNSVFIALQGSPWNVSRWTTLIADLKAIKVNNIIIADAVTESTAWYPTKIPGLTYAGVDVLEMALAAADADGLSVYMGMLLPSNWFHYGAMNATYLTKLTGRVNAIATELHSMYGGHQSLQGFYHAAEVYSTCCYSSTTRCNAAHINALGLMLEPTGQLVHKLKPEYKYVLAPYALNVSTAETAWWASLLALTPSVDIVAFQDGVGVSQSKPYTKRSPQQASELIKAVSEALPKSMHMWTDIEIFSKLTTDNDTRRLVAPTARFLQQLELEAPFVQGQTIWEFTHYMDPHGCHGALQADCLRLL